MKCLNDKQLISYQNQLLKKIEQEKVQEHLLLCERCQQMLKDYEAMQEAVKRSFSYRLSYDSADCYEEEELLSFLEGGIKEKAQKKFYAHLAHCHSCVDRLISLDRFLQELKAEGLTATERSKFENAKEFIANGIDTTQQKLGSFWDGMISIQPVYRWAGIILIMVVISFSLMFQNKSADDVMNTRETNVNQAPVQLDSPANGSLIGRGGLGFKWKGSKYITSYSLLILDSGGNIIWEKKTDQTKLTLPSQIKLQPSEIYFWQVEAFFENGGSVVSDMASFTYTP
jgi:hypothetical protein